MLTPVAKHSCHPSSEPCNLQLLLWLHCGASPCALRACQEAEAALAEEAEARASLTVQRDALAAQLAANSPRAASTGPNALSQDSAVLLQSGDAAVCAPGSSPSRESTAPLVPQEKDHNVLSDTEAATGAECEPGAGEGESRQAASSRGAGSAQHDIPGAAIRPDPDARLPSKSRPDDARASHQDRGPAPGNTRQGASSTTSSSQRSGSSARLRASSPAGVPDSEAEVCAADETRRGMEGTQQGFEE